MANFQPSMEYDPKNMQFRNLGNSGLRVPILSLGGWLSFGHVVEGDPVADIIKIAFENGINMIDTAESYAGGKSEREIGRVLKKLGYRRTDWIISTKIFFGVRRKGPNDVGLSRKHIIEGVNESLERLQVDYVDIVFAHRPDSTGDQEKSEEPSELANSFPYSLAAIPSPNEIVRAFNHVINTGKAFYWATSEWSARQIEEAFHVADELKLIPPIADQCQYNGFYRQRFEVEYKPIFQKYRYGTTVFSALASGVLTGKYNNGIPEDSRFSNNPDFFKNTIDALTKEEGLEKIRKVKELTTFAEKELGCTVSQLALAWVAKNPNTSTVILGATKPQQLLENLKALEVLPKITDEIYQKINDILANDPKPDPTWFGDR